MILWFNPSIEPIQFLILLLGISLLFHLLKREIFPSILYSSSYRCYQAIHSDLSWYFFSHFASGLAWVFHVLLYICAPLPWNTSSHFSLFSIVIFWAVSHSCSILLFPCGLFCPFLNRFSQTQCYWLGWWTQIWPSVGPL